MSGRHVNIALFVPHEGCPHQCSFCNQKSISGKSRGLTVRDINEAMTTALSSGAENMEIAFFGGSFTAIERGYMCELLEAASKYIDGKRVSGIRISTRPDAVDREICDILRHYGVTAAELGAQSMDDDVLAMNKRGHNAAAVENASRLIKESGIGLGLQMMTGLYGGSFDESVFTAKKLIGLRPETVRIYPTIVLEGTPLAELYRSGEYKPQTTEEAVELCSALIPMFDAAGITVIRLGLHSGGGVEDGYLAGPYHPSFRELCDGKIYLANAKKLIEKENNGRGEFTLCVAPEYISQMTGQKKKNLKELAMLGYACTVKPRAGLKRYEVRLGQEGE